MTIKEVEKIVRIDRATVRFYEKEGLFITQRNPGNGYREYSGENVEDLKKIVFLRSLGISIEQIKNMKNGSEAMAEVASLTIVQAEKQQENLAGTMQVLEMMEQDKSLTYDTLSTEKYTKDTEKSEQENSRKLLWLLVAASLLMSVSVYPLLPEKVMIDWTEYVGTTGRNMIFLSPVVLALVILCAKTGVLYMLHQIAPLLIYLTDKLVRYCCMCVAGTVITWEITMILSSVGIEIQFLEIFLLEIFMTLICMYFFLLRQVKVKCS